MVNKRYHIIHIHTMPLDLFKGNSGRGIIRHKIGLSNIESPMCFRLLSLVSACILFFMADSKPKGLHSFRISPSSLNKSIDLKEKKLHRKMCLELPFTVLNLA